MSKKLPIISCIPLFLLYSVVTAQGQQVSSSPGDWPWWRGPNSNGIADAGQAPPISWDDTKNVVWKTPVPGRGHSSPIVVGQRIFLATADHRSQVQSVVCFDREPGKQLWQAEINKGGFPEKIHNKNTHASPTVASDGERLYISFYNHDSIQVAALDLDGKIIWTKVAGDFIPRKYKYGYAASPLIYKSLVIVVADYDGKAFMSALDRKTGDVKWKVGRPGKLSWSSPVVANVAGKDQLLISGCELVASYDPNNGKELWSCKATTSATCGTMIWEGDLVFASGGYPKPETVCILGDGSGKIVWKNNQKCYEQSMLVVDGYVYCVTDSGVAVCWKADDGREMWKARLAGPVSASPIFVGGNIYASNERGTTFVFKADPKKFQAVSRNQLGSESFATPTIINSQILLRVADSQSREYLYCIGK